MTNRFRVTVFVNNLDYLNRVFMVSFELQALEYHRDYVYIYIYKYINR